MQTMTAGTLSDDKSTRVAGLRVWNRRHLIALDEVLPDAGDKVSIGRTRQRDIRLRDGTVSREHCTIRRLRDGTFEIRDSRSKNGLWVSRHGAYGHYERKKRVTLEVGMHVRLGEEILVVVDEHGMAPIVARRYTEFLRLASLMYGSAARAARHIGARSQTTILAILGRKKWR